MKVYKWRNRKRLSVATLDISVSNLDEGSLLIIVIVVLAFFFASFCCYLLYRQIKYVLSFCELWKSVFYVILNK